MAKIFGLMRIGNDPELRYLPDGTAVLNLSLAYNYGRKGDDGKTPSQWISASLFGKRAESLTQYLTKGSQHGFLISDPHIEEYEGKNGKGIKLAGRIDDIELGARSSTTSGENHPHQPAVQRPPQKTPAASGFDDFTDDIPF